MTADRQSNAMRLLQLERLIRPLGDNTFEVQSEKTPGRYYAHRAHRARVEIA